MKIQVVKKGNLSSKAFGACPFLVDNPPPDGVDGRKAANKQ